MSTILIIDGDVFGRNIFARALAEDDHTVLHADSLLSARAILSNEPVDLILVDAQLENGEPLRLAYEHHEHANTPLIILDSVFDEGEHRQHDGQRIHLVHKPVSPAELTTRVGEALSGISGPSPHPGSIERRQRQAEFASALNDALTELEGTIREEHVREGSLRVPLTTVDGLEGDARALGLVRVAQALARIRQVLLKLEERQGQLNRELWAELNDAIEDATLGTYFLLAQRIRARDPDSAARQRARVLVYDHDYPSVRQLVDYGNRHLIEVVHVANDDDFTRELDSDDFDGVFIDSDTCADRDATFAMARELIDSQRVDAPVVFFGQDASFADRIAATRAGAERFLEKPIELTEFADAVRHVTAQHRAETPRIAVCDPDPVFCEDARSALEFAGYEVHAIAAEPDFPRVLDRLDPHCLLLNQQNGVHPGIDVCRALRAMPRWTDLPIVLLSDETNDALLRRGPQAGADDVFTKPVDFAEVAAALRVSIQRYRTQRERSDYDLLTGVLTRRAFLERVATRLSEARRRGRALAIGIIDLDHFKRVNDTYGHLPGDRVLSAMGRLLLRSFRLEDLQCRWGGEEFAIALIDETSAGAKLALERTLAEFRSLEFRGENGELFSSSFSAGVAQFPDDGEQFEALLARADERLFEAKIAGRNRIVS